MRGSVVVVGNDLFQLEVDEVFWVERTLLLLLLRSGCTVKVDIRGQSDDTCAEEVEGCIGRFVSTGRGIGVASGEGSACLWLASGGEREYMREIRTNRRADAAALRKDMVVGTER